MKHKYFHESFNKSISDYFYKLYNNANNFRVEYSYLNEFNCSIPDVICINLFNKKIELRYNEKIGFHIYNINTLSYFPNFAYIDSTKFYQTIISELSKFIKYFTCHIFKYLEYFKSKSILNY